MEYPISLRALEAELLEHSKKGRSDAGFRLSIALAQFGHLAAHFTHDPVENQIARPYGTKDGEINDAGHAIVQLCTYVALRGINIQEAVNSALYNLRTNDFIKKEKLHVTDIKGTCACEGRGPVTGFAFVDQYCLNLEKMPYGSILVANHPNCNISHHQSKCSGIITDHGGFGCHAAIIAREYNISCLVGTGDATEKIKTGDIIILDTKNNIVEKMRV
jgi:phosphohistidine swiveling domain-containing protein